ncbi:MAG: M20 family metallo-hydrolase [Actinobacteria bacterium]|nr:M20 family metallo-hydrolase [Actinomycetota bacterium]
MSGSAAADVMQRADALARCTETVGEITRPYGSPSLVRARDLVAGWMREIDLTTDVDAIGNLTGRRGATDGAAFVLGSHLDSVRNAGRYDGPLGILVALAAAERTRGSRSPLEIVAFADEEGLRFRSSYLASRAYAGLLDATELAAVDDDGVPLVLAAADMGGDLDRIASAARRPDGVLGYLEVHIEQGPVLEAEGLPVGVVTAIAGQSRGFVDLVGRAGHAGNTPPDLRADALCAAAELVLAIEREMHDTPGLIATVGRIDNAPNVGNVIPGLTTVSYDVRHHDDAQREAAIDRLRGHAAEIAGRRRGVEARWRHLQDHEAVPMSGRLRERLAAAVTASGVAVRELRSGAGHDAVAISTLTPEVAMLFIRCQGGISHHPDESVTEEDVAIAIDVVTAFLESFDG